MPRKHEPPVNIRAKLPATLQSVDEFCIQMSHQLANNLAVTDVFAAELLVREALNNSVMYGSANGLVPCIECEIVLSVTALTIHCKDHGDGFDWRTKLAATAEPNAISGRGHTIFRSFANTVTYNDKGNELTLVRKLARSTNIEK